MPINIKPVKLPRKRKKAMIKKEGRANYIADQIVGQVLIEGDPDNERYLRKFPRTGFVRGQKFHVTSWW